MTDIAKYSVILELRSDVAKLKNDLKQAKKEAGGLTQAFNTALGVFGGLQADRAFENLVGTIKNVTKQAINLAAEFETTAASFEIFAGSADKAKRILQDIDDFSIATPFDPKELQEVGKLLLSFGTTTKDLLPDLKALGAVSAATGVNLNRIGLIFGQVQAKGRLMGEELLQFREAGVPAVELLAQSMGKTRQEVEKLIGDKAIGFKQLRKAFREAAAEGGKFGDALEKQAKTLAGLRSTLDGAINALLRAFGDRFLPIIKETTSNLISFVNTLREFIEVPIEQKIEKERLELNALVSSISDTNIEEERRKDLIEELNEKYPFFLQNIEDEELKNKDLKDRLDEVNDLYIKRIALQSQQDEIEKLLRESGEDLVNNLEGELEVRKELEAINSRFGLNIDTVNTPLEVQIRLLQSALGLRAQFGVGARGGSEALNPEAVALQGFRGTLARSGLLSRNFKETERELTDAQKRLKELEASLGITIAEINKIFNGETEDTEGGGSSNGGDPDGKNKTALEKARENLAKLKKELEDAIFTGNAKKINTLSKAYFELEESISAVAVKLSRIGDDTSLGVFISRLGIGEVSSDDPTQRAKEQNEQLREVTKNYTEILFQRARIQELIKDGEIDEKKELERQKALLETSLAFVETEAERLAIVRKILELKNQIDNFDDGESPSSFLQLLFPGINSDLEDQIGNAVNQLDRFANALLAKRAAVLDQEVDLQRQRVDKAVELAEKGNVELLQLEEERLSELEKKRNEARAKQAALNKAAAVAEIATNTALTVSNLLVAISKEGAKKGPLGAAIAVAVLAGLLGTAGTLFTPPSFDKGTERLQHGDNIDGKGGKLIIAHKNERILTERQNQEIGYDFPNEMIPEAVRLYRMRHPKIKKGVMAKMSQSSSTNIDMSDLTREMSEMRKDLRALKISMNMDEKGFHARVQKRHDGVIRRETIRG